MHSCNVLYLGLTIVVLGTLLLLAASLPGTTALTAHTAAGSSASWQEVGSGSASGGGISDNSSHSYEPSWITGSITPCLYLPLVAKGYCACGPDNYEPNDWCDQAYGPLTSGQTYQSYISCCDVATYKKSDYFYIDISTTNTIKVHLTDIPAGADYDLYLYRKPSDDPNGEVVKANAYGNDPETISYPPPATGTGIYYIRVYGYSGFSESPYSLRVTYDLPLLQMTYLPIICVVSFLVVLLAAYHYYRARQRR